MADCVIISEEDADEGAVGGCNVCTLAGTFAPGGERAKALIVGGRIKMRRRMIGASKLTGRDA